MDLKESSVAVLGAGSWGTALAALLAAAGRSVRLWGRDAALTEALGTDRENRRYLPGIPLPENVASTSDLASVLEDAGSLLFAVPCSALRAVAEEVKAIQMPQSRLRVPRLVSAAKGLEAATGLRMSQVLAKVFPDSEERIVVLSGPNLALEMARGVPTASVAASVSEEAAHEVQQLFVGQPAPTLRVYTGRDVVGVELGGAVKNVIAIGAGICDGLGYGDNAKAALMTRGLTEAVRLGVAQGADPMTFMGLSGVGDLIATGSSRLSRNYRVGYALGQGRTLAQILQELGQVAEGVPTTRVLHELAARFQVEMPLCAMMHAVLFEDITVTDGIRRLMQRPLGRE